MDSTRTVTNWTSWSVAADKGETIRVTIRSTLRGTAMIGSSSGSWYGSKPAVPADTAWTLSRVAPATGQHTVGFSTGSQTPASVSVSVEILPALPVPPPVPDGPADTPWSVSGATIVGGDREPFIPVGANIGVNYSIGGNVWGDESTTPHTAEALEWGWNTVRINNYVSTETSWIETHGLTKTYAQTFKAAQNYLDAGFVVILAPMDVTAPISGSSEPRLTHIEEFARAAGERFKNEPRVWFNVNEPSRVTGSTFVDFHQRFIDAWREAGHENIYIADVLTNAQDPTWSTEPKIYTGPGPALNATRSNVVYGLHIYGGQAQDYDTQATFNARYTTYLQRCQAAGLAMLIGETGYRVDGRDQAGANPGAFNRNQRGYRAALVASQATDVGVLAWHGTFDLFTLKNSLQSSGYHGRPFYYPTAGADLSPMGQEFWNFTHRA